MRSEKTYFIGFLIGKCKENYLFDGFL